MLRYLIDGEKVLPPLVPGRSLLSAIPRTDRFMACSLVGDNKPLDSFFTDGHWLSSVNAEAGMYHVMFNPFQHVIVPDAAYVANDQHNMGPDTIFIRHQALDPLEHPGAGILAAFWASRGIAQPLAWGLQRIRPAKVIGQVAVNHCLSDEEKLLTDYGTYRLRPGMFLVREESGDHPRPYTRGMMSREFSRLCRPDGTVVVDFDRPADPRIT